MTPLLHNISDLQKTVKAAKQFVESLYHSARGQDADSVDVITFESDVVIIDCHTTFRGEWDATFTHSIPYKYFMDGDTAVLRGYFEELKNEKRRLEEEEKARKVEERKRLEDAMNIKQQAEDHETYLRLKAKYEGP